MKFGKIDGIGAALLVALPAGAYWLGIAPTLRANAAARALSDQLAQQRTQQDSLERVVSAMRKATNAAATSQPAVRLVPLSELNRRLADLNELAGRDGVQIDSLDPGQTGSHERYSSTAIAMNAHGSYPACEKWLADLPAAAADVAVTQWNVTSATTDKNGDVQLTAALRWYALPPAAKK